MSEALERARSEFRKKLDDGISLHSRKRKFDAFLHQALIIGSALAGFAALALGLVAQGQKEYAVWAGLVGALTSVATILSQQLHCVKAVNWHERMATELEIIRDKFLFKFKSAPTEQELSALTDEVAKLNRKMVDAWEKITASGPSALGRLGKPSKEPA